jgi:type I restriction-modification system DNA methylase subunit
MVYDRRISLNARVVVAKHTLRNLLGQIKEIEEDTQTDVTVKLSQIKKIKEEITKVGTEIDSIKREITLLNTYNVN